MKENNRNNRVKRVDRRKSSSIVTGRIKSLLSNIKSTTSDIQGFDKDNLSKIGRKRNVTSKEQNGDETLKYRVIESIKHPTKKMLAIATITLSLIVGGISLSTCSKNPSKVNVATTESEQNNMEYTVREGDTLSKIASINNVTLDELAKFNNIEDPDNISIGMTILIPNVNMIEYTVQKGDTLSEIAIKYNTDIETIMSDNNIDNSNNIKVGDVLKIRSNNDLVSLNYKTRTRRII